MVGWHIVRIGGKRTADEYVDDVALIYVDGTDLVDELQRPFLLGQVRCRFVDGSVVATKILRNRSKMPADYAVMLLVDIDRRVEGCDDGEVAGLPIDVRTWVPEIVGRHGEHYRKVLEAFVGFTD